MSKIEHIDKIKKRYQRLPTLTLKELAHDFENMRTDALEVLLHELFSRGETDFIKTINEQIQRKSSMNNDTEPPGFDFLVRSFNQELEPVPEGEEVAFNEDFQAAFNEDSPHEKVRKAYDYLLKNISLISNRTSAVSKLSHEFDLTENEYDQVFQKIMRKVRQGFIVFGTIFGISFVSIGISVYQEKEHIYIPGFILIIWAISSLYSSIKLKRLLKETNELQDIL